MNILSNNFLCTIQETENYARSQVYEDSESYDEESASALDYEIGSSRYEADLENGWDDMPLNYEPTDEYEREEYYEYKRNKEDFEEEDY